MKQQSGSNSKDGKDTNTSNHEWTRHTSLHEVDHRCCSAFLLGEGMQANTNRAGSRRAHPGIQGQLPRGRSAVGPGLAAKIQS